MRALALVGLLGYTWAANAEVVQVRPWELQKHWFADLKGQGTLETAIDNIVAAIPRW